MRSWVPLCLTLAAFVAAQGSQNNVVNNPQAGIQATAGQPLTLTWENPSSGTITIKIQTSGDIQPSQGIVVAENIPNTGSATFPLPSDVPVGDVYVQIIDDTNPEDYNFSGAFQVQGATNTASPAASTAASTAASSAASSATLASSARVSPSSTSDSASSATTAESSTNASSLTSSTSESLSSSSSSSSSSSASSASGSSSSSASLSSRTSTTAASRTSSTSESAQSTTAPSGAAVPVKVQGGLMVVMLGAAALL